MDREEKIRVSEDKFALSARVKKLLTQSLDTLEAILDDDQLPPQERATVALKILEIAEVFTEFNGHSADKLIVSAQREIKQLQPEYSQINPNLPEPTATQQTESIFLPANYVEVKGFLCPEENEKFITEAINRRRQYMESNTTTKANQYRQSYVLFSKKIPALSALIRERIKQRLPGLLGQLNFSPFEIAEIEVQLTAHNDGCYYRIHNDAGSEKTATRQITYVYYFYQEPKAFSGGELKLYDTEFKSNTIITHPNFQTITPTNNSIIFFNSRCRHEVMPVICPSREFAHSRFTVNGWIRRTAE
ncbi:2OG-Fe(II) oxygenase [Synechocystis sp. PCC 7339]|uniref:2OG-Fe(II) oxygenase n=1 Tax=unclassified Synechocystis TaxID=2640012 RepID=UPI001BB007DD|nr:MULTISPECIES: 2OG-Fe(II) oxygenase [unclassified Synechocystis]QUS60483.1 2OG-Fe(II) oxygenase [Synechocystis sp. PCC 7338]UAJ72076.1 2OG-Fe(II) oxygenase [Synechocystis sp. PCC 7339]